MLATSVGQVMYKAYSSNKKGYMLVITVTMFVATTPFSYMALRELTIDLVYIATSLNSILVLTMSSVFLKEIVSREQYIGALVTTLGVAIYALN